jgi:hypothetical protein
MNDFRLNRFRTLNYFNTNVLRILINLIMDCKCFFEESVTNFQINIKINEIDEYSIFPANYNQISLLRQYKILVMTK